MVDTSAHVRRGHPIVFLSIAIFAFIGAVIASTLTSDLNRSGLPVTSETTGAVRFNVFSLWWTFLGSILFAVLFLTGKGGAVTSIAGHGIYLLLTWLFTLAGAGAITASVNDDSNPYHASRRALAGFAWIVWILITLMTAAVIFLGVKRGGRGGLKESL